MNSEVKRTFYFQILFLITGLIQTIGVQWLHDQKAANHGSFLTVLCLYLGMVSIKLLPESDDEKHKRRLSNASTKKFNVTSFWMVALFEVIGNIILTVGMFYVGSGLYQVIYSSVVVFNAIFCTLLLKRSTSKFQWMAIIIIIFGLSLQLIGGPEHETANSAFARFTGFLITLLGTALLATVYTLNDYYLTTTSSEYLQPTPRDQCFNVGLYSTFLCSITIVVLAIPSIMELQLGRLTIIFMYILLILSSLGHSAAYFELLKTTGAVSTGVLQALRAVLVFALSHYFFCSSDTKQCFTSGKWLSTIFVVIGVLTYAYAKSKSKTHDGGHYSSHSSIDEDFRVLPLVDDDDSDFEEFNR